MGKQDSIKQIYKMYEPELYTKSLLSGRTNESIFNLEDTKCFFFDNIYTLAISVPTWEGLPIEIDRAIMERILINNTSVVINYDEYLEKYVTLVLGKVAKYDIDGRPLEYSGMSLYGGVHYDGLNPENSVIIYDRITQVPTIAGIEFFASRLANIQLSIDQCIRNMKVPYIVSAPKNNFAELEALFTNIYEFKPNIILDGMVDLDTIKINDMGANLPTILTSLREEFTNTWNMALSFVGVSNVSNETSKHEQMSQYEVAKTTTASTMQQESRLKPRQQGAERLNEVFGLDVKVTFSQVMTALDGIDGKMYDERFDDTITEGGEVDG